MIGRLERSGGGDLRRTIVGRDDDDGRGTFSSGNTEGDIISSLSSTHVRMDGWCIIMNLLRISFFFVFVLAFFGSFSVLIVIPLVLKRESRE